MATPRVKIVKAVHKVARPITPTPPKARPKSVKLTKPVAKKLTAQQTARRFG